jgi:tRNA threonylcarbamoyladenosine biosynthesis protein TsaE
VIARSAAETQALGAALGELVRAGDVLALDGELGSGKTCFVQGLARGLGVAAEARVHSPTFTLINEHRGRLTLYHIDLYRLEREDELEQIGLVELLGSNGVCAVEWAERFPRFLPRDRVELRFTILGEEERRIDAVAHGDTRELVEAWGKKLAPTS